MSPHVHVIRASTPWEGTHGAPEISAKDEAPREGVAYVCPRCGPFTVTLAAGAEVPDVWDCRCGTRAVRDGAEGKPEGDLRLPAYAGPGTGKYERPPSDGVTPMAQLRKRRTPEQGEAILAEALERIRGTGEAR